TNHCRGIGGGGKRPCTDPLWTWPRGGQAHHTHLSSGQSTILELCAQLEHDLLSAIRCTTVIPSLLQVLSVHHFLATDSFQ
ncbi:hypothetical protein NDU88_008055, partial [Pleurodeles waltl]